jgi:hypothetical protein
MSDTNLTVERKDGTGHYVISAMVVDEYDNEFLHSIQFWGYDQEDFENRTDMMKCMKDNYLASLSQEKFALS